MAIRYTLSKTCDFNSHQELTYVGELDGIVAKYCPVCAALRLQRTHWTAPHIDSIRQTAEAFREVVPKALPDKVINTAALKQDVIKWCRTKYGMGSDAVHTAVHWLVRAGKNFNLAVNGVPHLIEAGLAKEGGMYEALVRLRDVFGDPPVTYPLYTCIGCGKRWNVEDLVVAELFSCSCGNFYRYGENVEPILKVNLKETWDLKGNYLEITLKNMQDRVVPYCLNLLKNGALILADEGLKLAPEEEMVRKLPHGEWTHNDRLQVQIWDRDTNESYGESNEVRWSNHPWAPAVAITAIGVSVIVSIIAAAAHSQHK